MILRHNGSYLESYDDKSHAFYRATLEIVRTQAEHVLYIDDTLENVQAASGIGILSHHYSGVDEMATFLAEMLMVGW